MGVREKILIAVAVLASLGPASAMATSVSAYLKAVDKYTELNESMSCGYTSYRWIKPVPQSALESNKLLDITLYAQEDWAKTQTEEALTDEVTELEQRIEQCRNKATAPMIPAQGKNLRAFIPAGWQALSKKAYKNEFTRLDLKPVFSPIEETIFTDLDGDGRNDTIALIGRKTITDIGFDDFRLLVLMANEEGYRLLYNVKAELNDLPTPNDVLSRASITIEKTEAANAFLVTNIIAYDHNRSDKSASFTFTYDQQHLALSRYSYSNMYFSYDSSPEQKRFTETYDFAKNTRQTFNSQNTDVRECSYYSPPEEAIECPAPIEKEEQLAIPEGFYIDLSDLVNFNPIEWESSYDIKIEPPLKASHPNPG